MAKQEWGAKHSCLGCGAKFYDMGRNPIACPACGELVSASVSGRTRRSRRDEVKEKPARSGKEVDGVVADEGDILSDEVEDLVDDEDGEDDIVTLADNGEEEDTDVLAEADIDTGKIGDE